MRGIPLSKIEEKHFHLPETEPEAGAFNSPAGALPGQQFTPSPALTARWQQKLLSRKGADPGTLKTLQAGFRKLCVCQVLW